MVLDKLFQVLVCLGDVCNFNLCNLLEYLFRETLGCLLKQEEATVLELKNIRRGIRCVVVPSCDGVGSAPTLLVAESWMAMFYGN